MRVLQVATGQVNSSKDGELGLGAHVDVSMDGPAVLVFCNGDTGQPRVVPLPAEKKGRALIKLFNEYKGGAKCRQGVYRITCWDHTVY